MVKELFKIQKAAAAAAEPAEPAAAWTPGVPYQIQISSLPGMLNYI